MDTRQRDFRTGELEERRAEERHKALKGARILFNSGYGALECIVRNLSHGGARLEFGDSAAVPSRFSIYLNESGERHEAAVQWRLGGAVGVSIA